MSAESQIRRGQGGSTNRTIAHRPADEPVPLPFEGHLPTFEGAIDWINTQPLTLDGLQGRVVAVDFWTYTCINWIRTLPYLRAWNEKYRDRGLTIVGVHTPEFGFERDLDNVEWAVRDMSVEYPVAVDSGYAVWRAFGNHYWPGLYIADGRGRIRYHHFGEGEYAMAEMVIQQLLIEAGTVELDLDLVMVEPKGLEVAADWTHLGSAETYLGSDRLTGFGSPDTIHHGEPHYYPESPRLGLNDWAPSGMWTIATHAALSNEPGARLSFRFQARDLNLVMGPATRDLSIRYRVEVDGKPPRGCHGGDVDEEGVGLLTDQRLHQLIRQQDRVDERLFEIEFLDAGAEVYCFTFG